MAVTTITDLLNRANTVINETEPDANSEQRIGSLLRDMVDTLATDSGSSKVTLPSPVSDGSIPTAIIQPMDVKAWQQTVWNKFLYLFQKTFNPQSMQELRFYRATPPPDSEVSSAGGDLWYNTSDNTLSFAEWSGIDGRYVNWIPQDIDSTVLYIFGTDVYYYNGSFLVKIASLLPPVPETADKTGLFLRGDGSWAELPSYAQKPVDVIFVAYIQPDTPADNSLGDLWIDDSNVLDDVGGILKMYNAGTWQPTEAEDGMIYKSEDRSEVWVVNAQNTLTKLIQAGDSGGGSVVDISSATAQPTNEIYNGKKVYCMRYVFNVNPHDTYNPAVDMDNLQELWIDYGNSWANRIDSGQNGDVVTSERTGIRPKQLDSDAAGNYEYSAYVLSPQTPMDAPYMYGINDTDDMAQFSILIKFTYR